MDEIDRGATYHSARPRGLASGGEKGSDGKFCAADSWKYRSTSIEWPVFDILDILARHPIVLEHDGTPFAGTRPETATPSRLQGTRIDSIHLSPVPNSRATLAGRLIVLAMCCRIERTRAKFEHDPRWPCSVVVSTDITTRIMCFRGQNGAGRLDVRHQENGEQSQSQVEG